MDPEVVKRATCKQPLPIFHTPSTGALCHLISASHHMPLSADVSHHMPLPADASTDHMMEMVANMPPVALPRTSAEFEALINGAHQQQQPA